MALVIKSEGSDPAPGAGSVIAKAERISPFNKGYKNLVWIVPIKIGIYIFSIPALIAIKGNAAGKVSNGFCHFLKRNNNFLGPPKDVKKNQ